MKVEREIRFDGIEPIYVRRTEKEHGTDIYKASLFYPFKRVLFKTRVWLEWNWLELKGGDPQRCAMCGEDIAKVKIPDPNGEPEMVDVCERCRKWVNDTRKEIMRRAMNERLKEIKSKRC